MKIAILHYAIITNDGELEIDCSKFKSTSEARFEQNNIIEQFINTNDTNNDKQIEESIGTFRRISYQNQLAELQSHIEEFIV